MAFLFSVQIDQRCHRRRGKTLATKTKEHSRFLTYAPQETMERKRKADSIILWSHSNKLNASCIIVTTQSLNSLYISRPRCQRQISGDQKAVCLSSSVQALSLDVTTPPDSYSWNYRELAILPTSSESLAEGGFQPLTIRSMRNNLTTELP